MKNKDILATVRRVTAFRVTKQAVHLSILAIIFCLPIIALAARGDLAAGCGGTCGLAAGFAPNSIWVSRTHVTAGDSVNIFTVLYNASDTSIAGDADFTIDGKTVGTRNFSVKPGETQIESIPWTATVGTHSVFARIEKISDADTNASASVLNQTTDTITISVAAPPPPTPQAQAIASVTNLVSAGVAEAAPMAQSAGLALENLRQRAIDALQKQLAAATSNPTGEVLSASTSKAPRDAAAASSDTGISFFGSLWRGILAGLLYICRLQVLFYGVLALVIFILYQLLRAWMRERRMRSF